MGSNYSLEQLEELLHSVSPVDRRIAAGQGYRLDLLVHDPDPWVRRMVAFKGYGLDVLVNDVHYAVRLAVAEMAYGLDKLVNDPDVNVRCAVAEQGYGFDVLAFDDIGFIQGLVERALLASNLTLEEWIAQNPNKCALSKNRSLEGRLACAEARSNAPQGESVAADKGKNKSDYVKEQC